MNLLLKTEPTNAAQFHTAPAPTAVTAQTMLQVCRRQQHRPASIDFNPKKPPDQAILVALRAAAICYALTKCLGLLSLVESSAGI